MSFKGKRAGMLGVLITLALLGMLLSGGIGLAQGTQVVLPDLNVAPGAGFSVDVTVADVTDPDGLGAYDFRVAYSPAVISLVNITGGDAPFNTTPVQTAAAVANAQGYVDFNNLQAAIPGPIGTLVVARMNFTAVGSGGQSSLLDLTINPGGLTDSNGEDIAAAVVDGSVTLVAPPVCSFQIQGEPDWIVDAGQLLQFQDTSTNAPDTWEWDFESDALIDSTAQNPTWTYNTPAVYGVTLHVSNGAGEDLCMNDVTVEPGPLDSVVLTLVAGPASPALSPATTFDIGETARFDAQGYDAVGNAIPGLTYTFDSATGMFTVAVVDTNTADFTAGTVSGDYPAEITATATYKASTVTGTEDAVINPDPLASVVLTLVAGPASPALSPATTFDIGQTATFDAQGFDQYGNAIPGLTYTFASATGVFTVAVVDTNTADFTAGTVSGDYPAEITATATYKASTVTGTEDAVINPDPLFHVQVNPAVATLMTGACTSFSATGHDQYGNEIPGIVWTWDADPAAGVIDNAGNFCAGLTTGTFVPGVAATGTFKGSEVTGFADVIVVSLLAEIDMTKSVDPDGVVVVNVCAVRAYRPDTGETVDVPGGMGDYDAMVTFDPTGINILAVRPIAPFDAPVVNIQNGLGWASFNAVQLSTPDLQPPLCVASLVVRLVDSHLSAFDLTLDMDISDWDGNMIPNDANPVESFRRGDAKADGTLTVGDALFVAQYLAGLRGLGQTTLLVHPVNAASVRQDTGGDKITVADRLFIAQRLANLRDSNFNLL